jgi:predicted nucleic acid-binding protein
MYLVGASHPNKRRVVDLVPRLIASLEPLVTSAETFQEVVHRYVALRDREHLDAAYEALEAMVVRIAEITKADVDTARAMSARYGRLSSRDCLHVAVMKRLGCTKVWTYDAGFDVVAGVLRVG